MSKHIDTWTDIWTAKPYIRQEDRLEEGTPEYDHRIEHCGPQMGGCYHSYVHHSPPHEDGECETVVGVHDFGPDLRH